MTSNVTNNNVRGNPWRIRDPQNSSLLEIWLVAAVVTVLAIRLYLYLTGYPQVGGDTLHIAHMLWGGLGMVIAFGFLLLFANPVWKPLAALVGGVGFGTFIDELGKFITKDNDYFYQPAIAVMYAVFIAFYFAARYFDRKRQPTEADHLYLATQGVAWQAIGKLDKRRRDDVLAHLDASGNTSDVAERLRDLLEHAEIVEQAENSRILELRDRITDRYWNAVSHRWLLPAVIGLFVVRAVQILITLVVGFVGTDQYDFRNGLSVTEWLFLGGRQHQWTPCHYCPRDDDSSTSRARTAGTLGIDSGGAALRPVLRFRLRATRGDGGPGDQSGDSRCPSPGVVTGE